MMRWIVGSSLKFRFLVVGLAAAVVFVGVGEIRGMPVDVFPEFSPPKVEIQTPALGLNPTEVESLITVPLEHALQGIPGLDVIRSGSAEQVSQIVLLFEPGTDVIRARQLVSERITTVAPTLPSWSMPPMILQPMSSTSRVMKIGLSSDSMSMIELSMIANWKIRQRLLRVPGVANTPIWGERKQMLHVQADPERMLAQEVSLQQLMQVTADSLDAGLLRYSNGAVVGTGGFIDTPNQRLSIRHKQTIVEPEQLGGVVIEERGGRTLRISDVADVVVDHQPLIGDAVINDGPGLMLIVEKLPWANTLEVTRGVDEALEALKPGLAGVEIDATIFRPANFIESAIDNLGKALLIGCLLMILMLGAFLWSWRVALISVTAIPLSLVAAAMVLHWRGTTINTMVLAGFAIALGDIVDDAIIDVENVVRRLRLDRAEGRNSSRARIILDASLEVRGAIVYATLIEVLAVMPVFFLSGLSGAFFRPLAFSYALALLVSMVVALTVTPALALIMLRKASLEEREPPLTRWLQRGYERIVSRVISSPRPALGAVAVIVVAGLAVVPTLGQDLLPEFKERDFLMHWLTKPGTSLPEEVRITTASSKELRDIPGVRNFGAHIGQALHSDEPYGVYFGENWISVDPKADYEKTLAAVQETVDGYPGLYRDVQTYLKERIREVLTGSSQAIVLRIFGQDLDTLRTKAKEVEHALSGVEGVVDLHTELQTEIPQVDIEVDLAAAQRYGLKPGDVRRAAATLMASEEMNDVWNQRIYDVRVWSTPETRKSLSSIKELPIDVPSGGHVKLADVADVRIAPTNNIIKRENSARRIDVSANTRGRDLGSVVRDVEAALETVDFPLEFRAELLGEYSERKAASKRVQTLAIVAGIGILLLLQASFGSWRLASLSFLLLPMAAVGGALAAYMTGGILSLGSLVGFLTVLGIVARNNIMLISHYQHLERYEGMPFGPALVVRGARERLAPILMTVATTGLALVPLLIGGGTPGKEIEHPMAVVIMGGLIASTLLNLFVVPALYLRFGKSRRLALRAATS
jgi:CzcA family heavy metal efflux pump